MSQDLTATPTSPDTIWVDEDNVFSNFTHIYSPELCGTNTAQAPSNSTLLNDVADVEATIYKNAVHPVPQRRNGSSRHRRPRYGTDNHKSRGSHAQHHQHQPAPFPSTIKPIWVDEKYTFSTLIRVNEPGLFCPKTVCRVDHFGLKSFTDVDGTSYTQAPAGYLYAPVSIRGGWAIIPVVAGKAGVCSNSNSARIERFENSVKRNQQRKKHRKEDASSMVVMFHQSWFVFLVKASPSLTAALMEKQKELHEEALSEILKDAADVSKESLRREKPIA
ncbi:hypothetical protein HDV05_004796 [Chytridiales sp. JEL 0842]|nr:hypothetical protein HDV05_004796 [Chytridiales sp. JEL 0842]